MLIGYCGSISCLEDCRFCALYDSSEIQDIEQEMQDFWAEWPNVNDIEYEEKE